MVIIVNFKSFAQQNRVLEYSFQDKDGNISNSTLYIVKNESLYRIDDKRENGVDEKNFGVVNNDEISKLFFSNDSISYTRIPLYKNEIIYKQPIIMSKFLFTGKTKKINNFNCQEAKLELNGRSYNIWFTADVEINKGPYKINGLPGLIVEINEQSSKVKIKLKKIKKLNDISIFEKYKNYILSKHVLEYSEYDVKITDILKLRKVSGIAKVKEMGGSVQFDENQSFYTQFLIDIPTNLISELQKIN